MLHDSGRNPVDQPLALVVDKDVSLRAAVREALEQLSIVTLGASAGAEALERLRDRSVGVLVIGDTGPGVSADDLARHALELQPTPVVFLLVDEADQSDARAWVERGAFDVVSATSDKHALELLALRARRQLDTQQVLHDLRRQLQTREGYHRIVGRSPAMDRVRQEVERLGAAPVSVWLSGEPGTGKKLVARSVHSASPRKDHPFVVVHCAGVEERDAAHVWSRSYADPGAEAGWFERADGGSLFLDGITELPLTAQESLAKALRQDKRPDVRLLVAASGTPEQSVEGGKILEELRDALGAGELELAPLASRSEDLALLARHFISTITEINHLPPMRLAPESLSLLERYHWPGNVRELRNAIEHAVILATDGIIRPKDLPDPLRDQDAAGQGQTEGMSARSFREAKREVVGTFEQAYLSDLLKRHHGNVTSASQQAGMLRSALQRLLRKYGLKSADFRQGRLAGRRRGPDGSSRSAGGA